MYFLKFSNQWFGFDPQSIIVVVVTTVILFEVSDFSQYLNYRRLIKAVLYFAIALEY